VIKCGLTTLCIFINFKLIRVSIKLVLFGTYKLYCISHNACLDIVFVFDELWEIVIFHDLLSGLKRLYSICEFNHTECVLCLLISRTKGLGLNVP
jgi:hypothetical protein